MTYNDLPEAELKHYRSTVATPVDFDDFWGQTLAESRNGWWEPEITRIATDLRLVDVYDVTFAGYGGEPIRAWYFRPSGSADDLPVVVEYAGYGGGRGSALRPPPWVLAGYASLLMDMRGQGSNAVRNGHTADPHGTGPSYAGFMTRGIESPQTYYYRRVYTDAVLAVDCARSLPGVDSAKVAVAGGSQGGGITLAAAGLCAGLVTALVDVPFLSDFPRAIQVAGRSPYNEITQFLAANRDSKETTLRTLSYFDASVFAARARIPALFSVALLDEVTPPSTVYASYNAYVGQKAIVSYDYNGHEGGGSFHEAKQFRWLSKHLGGGDFGVR